MNLPLYASFFDGKIAVLVEFERHLEFFAKV